MAIAPIISITVVPRDDNGRLDTHYLDGDTTPSADVIASQAVPNDLANLAGAFSLDSGQYFTGADVGSGTISFVATVGSLAGVGLSVVSQDITGTGVEGSVTGHFSWTDGSEVFITNNFTISFVTQASVTDSTAPTIPVGVTVSSNGTTLTVTHDPSSDPWDGTNVGSGMASYRYLLDGVEVDSGSALAGLSPICSDGDIGTLSPAGSGTRTGAGGTLISEGFIGENSSGTGYTAYNDVFHYEGLYAYTGNFTRSVKITSIANATVTFDKSGIMARFGLDADDPFVFLGVRSGGAIRLEYRSVKGGPRSTLGSLSYSTPVWLKLKLVGSMWTGYVSTDSNTFEEVANVSMAPPGTFYLMLAGCSSSDGNEITVTYANDSFWTGSVVTKNITTTSLGLLTITATDAQSNTSAASEGVTARVVNSPYPLFPGTSLRFYPGFIVPSTENASLSSIESAWQSFFTGTPNRKQSWRPTGIYGGIKRRLQWDRFYVNPNVRPTDPTDHTDAGYDWSLIDTVFDMNCVANEGALVMLDIMMVKSGSPCQPAWIRTSPYNGTWLDSLGRTLSKMYRYSGQDILGRTNQGSSPYIVDEHIYFFQALYAHLVSTGDINKVHSVLCSEYFRSADATHPFPADYDQTMMDHGIGVLHQRMAQIFSASNICVFTASLLNGSGKTTRWPYVLANDMGMGFPDTKLNNTTYTGITGSSRFEDPFGIHQKDIRPLYEACESNGERSTTYFDPSIFNPWGYSNQNITQTASHLAWYFGGNPINDANDSGLGQAGVDPTGLQPVHVIVMNYTSQYTLAQWLTAIDTFGPPGTGAFPYLPAGYSPV